MSTTCPSLEYNINSTCGDCPTTTQLNVVTCAVETIAKNHTCSLSVRSVVCGNIMSNWSTPIYAHLKGIICIYFRRSELASKRVWGCLSGIG